MQVQLSASLREYIHAIRVIESEHGAVKANEIAKKLRVKRSSVTGALKSLSKRKLIKYSPYGPIILTTIGKKAANEEGQILSTLKKFFIDVLVISPEEAEESAKLVKRNAPHILVDRLTQFVKYLESYPRELVNWSKDLGFSCPPSICKPYNCHNPIRNIGISPSQKETKI